jgi:hypothetical protein
MSKFEELQKAYDQFRAEKIGYADACHKFAADLRRKFLSYIECPENNFKWFLPSKGFDSNDRTFYTQVGAMEMGDDGFWRAGIAIPLEPRRAVLLYVIEFKLIAGKFLVRLEGLDKEVLIEDGSGPELEDFVSSLVDLALDNYKHGFKNFIKQSGTRKIIGFNVLSREDST